MRVINRNAPDAEILAVCQEWLALVAADRIGDALDLLASPADGSVTWTPDSLRAYIGNYGSWEPWPDRSIYRVTAAETAVLPGDSPSRKPYADVLRLTGNHHRGWVNLDLPLNGVWSDLTAEFEFAPVADGIAISLHDIHVL